MFVSLLFLLSSLHSQTKMKLIIKICFKDYDIIYNDFNNLLLIDLMIIYYLLFIIQIQNNNN